MSKKVKWEDTSSRSRGTTSREVTTWTAKLGKSVEVIVKRHVYYAPDDWVLRVKGLAAPTTALESKDIAEAKEEALDIVRSIVSELARDVFGKPILKRTVKKGRPKP